MKHVSKITKSSIPQYAVPVVTNKEGCKTNELVDNRLACKSTVKKGDSYPL